MRVIYLILKDYLSLTNCVSDGLVRRFVRDDDGVHFDHPSPSYDTNDFVSIEVKAGSLVVIHGNLIHQRSVNLVTFTLGHWGIS